MKSSTGTSGRPAKVAPIEYARTYEHDEDTIERAVGYLLRDLLDRDERKAA